MNICSLKLHCLRVIFLRCYSKYLYRKICGLMVVFLILSAYGKVVELRINTKGGGGKPVSIIFTHKNCLIKKSEKLYFLLRNWL